MRVLYNFLILTLRTLFRIAALFHPKAKSFVKGRRGVFKRMKAAFGDNTSSTIWIHCASLGEFEQARPLIEILKKEYQGIKILLTFFSPSGYEVRKNYDRADLVSYLPWDTASNASKLVSIVKPSIVVFVKYEYWYHYTNALKKSGIPIVSISSIFRESQLFFKSYGGFYRGILKNFSHFFVQNDVSLKLLRSIGIQQCSLAGDTRFDRVYEIVKKGEELPIAQRFKNNQHTLVVGSCWPEDFEVLEPFINQNTIKFIIAPHEITEEFIQRLEKSLQVRSVRYSQAQNGSLQNGSLEDSQVLIIDNIGMLSRLYRYGEFAFVGGAFGKGLHNILEAACYGVPIFFGNKNYEKFREAMDLINRGGAFEVKDYTDFKAKYEMLNVPENFLLACEVTKLYVVENLGATEKIMRYCRTLLK